MKIAEFLKSQNIFEAALLPYGELRVVDPRREETLKARFQPESAVIFLMPYYVAEEKTNLSRYAQSRDYHFFVKELSYRAGELLECEFASFSDTSPIDEVGAALTAGLGCVGENGLLINPRYGSYVFIGEFFFPMKVTDPFFEGAEKKHSPQKCLGCKSCLKACPTGGIYDKSVCISCINQKKKITEEERNIIKKSGLVWGCDECQECCPMNRGEETPIEFFRSNRIPSLSNKLLSELVESGEFSQRAFAWRGENTLRRNLDIFESDKKASR